MNAAAVGISIAAVGGLLGLIAIRGLAHFWPADVALISQTTSDAKVIVGELIESERLALDQYRDASGDTTPFPADVIDIERWLVKTGNRRLDPPDFEWVYSHHMKDISYPTELAVFERMEWGNVYGTLVAVLEDGERVAEGDQAWDELRTRLASVESLREAIAEIEQGAFNKINYELEDLRLDRRRLEL
ncbi:MAG: phosphate ABC transporter, permease protein PstA, partial [Gammaproteobacteria bacterium]